VAGVIRGIAQIVAFVEDPAAAARFWGEVLEAPFRPVDGGALVEAPFAEIYFHPVDDERASSGELKNPWGSSTIAYLAVDDFDAARERLIAAGCVPWRGPIEIEGGRRICQLRDPYATVWGLDGP
jgi:predicted enzyme related to lactoylglutathione lyase